MKTTRRAFASSLAAGVFLPHVGRAQAWPNGRNIRVIVAFPPGGGQDVVSRIICDKLSRMWNVGVVVENKAGAGGNLGMTEVARAEANGEVILTTPPGMTTNPFLYDKVNFDPMGDFAHVSLAALVPNFVVMHPDKPFKTMTDIINYAKANPGRLTYAHSGNGTSIHLSGELFKYLTKTDIVQVPYRGSALAIQDLMAGRVDIMFDNISSSLSQVRAGSLRAIAITTLKRSALAPELPPVAETIPGFDVSSWLGYSVPKKTPEAIVAKLAADIKTAVNDPEVKAKLVVAGAESVGSTPVEFTDFVRKEMDVWGKVIREANIKVE